MTMTDVMTDQKKGTKKQSRMDYTIKDIGSSKKPYKTDKNDDSVQIVTENYERQNASRLQAIFYVYEVIIICRS